MRGKLKQYLLLGLVVVIWSVIVLRFFQYSDTNNPTTSPIQIDAEPSTTAKKPEVHYFLNYADPFLKQSAPKLVAPVKEPSQSLTIHKLPQAIFLGIVSSGARKIGIIRIAGKSVMVNEGDEVHDFRVTLLSPSRLQLYHIPSDSSVVLTPSRSQSNSSLSQN